MIMFHAQRNILDFTFSSIARRSGKNTAIFLVYTLTVALLASVMFFTHSLKREAALALSGAPDMVVQRLIAGRADLVPLNYVKDIRAIRGVTSVRGRLWGYYFDGGIGANYTVMTQSANGPEPGSVIVGEGVARTRKLAPGDLFPLRASDGSTRLFQVARTLSAESSLVSADLLLMAEDDFRSLFNISGRLVTDIVLTAGNPRELPTIAGKINRMFPDIRTVIKDDISRTYDSLFNWRSGVLLAVLLSSVLSFIIFAWDRASGLSAGERQEIGVLKATGWETSDVLFMKFWEGAAVSLSSFLAGITLAYVHVFLTSSALFQPVLKGWAVLYPDFRLVPYIDAGQLGVLFFIAVAPYTVATILPAWRAATIDPDAIMRA